MSLPDMPRWLAVFLLLTSWMGCSGDNRCDEVSCPGGSHCVEDTGRCEPETRPDAGTQQDAGTDAGTPPDSGTSSEDGGPSDAGVTDAGQDAGPSPVDGGPSDAGQDAGPSPVDGGPSDAGVTDAGTQQDAGTQPDAGPPPDTCAQAKDLFFPQGQDTLTFQVDLQGLSDDTEAYCNNTPDSPEAIYRLRLPAARFLDIRARPVAGSKADPVVYVAPAPCGKLSGNVLGCVDDYPQERLFIPFPYSGDQYLYVENNGRAGAGPVEVTVTLIDPVPPPNDRCDQAQVLSTFPAHVTGTLIGAADDVYVPASCLHTSNKGSPDVVYTFTTTKPQRMKATLTPDFAFPFNLTLHDSLEACATPYQPIRACNGQQALSDPSMLLTSELPPGQYYLSVEADYQAQGRFSLDVELLDVEPPPANDTCATATPLVFSEEGVAEVLGTTRGASNDRTLSCAAASANTGDVVYRFTTPDAAVKARIVAESLDLAGYTPAFELSAGCEPGAKSLDCHHADTALLFTQSQALTLQPNTEYFLWLDTDTYGALGGPFRLTVELAPIQPASTGMGSATPITQVGLPIRGTTTGYPDHLWRSWYGGPCDGDYNDYNAPDHVYSYKPTTSGPVKATIRALDQYRPSLFVLDATTAGHCVDAALSPLSGGPDYVKFTAQAGKTYYFAVDFWSAGAWTGRYDLLVEHWDGP